MFSEYQMTDSKEIFKELLNKHDIISEEIMVKGHIMCSVQGCKESCYIYVVTKGILSGNHIISCQFHSEIVVEEYLRKLAYRRKEELAKQQTEDARLAQERFWIKMGSPEILDILVKMVMKRSD